MTTENSNLKTVTLVGEQYVTALKALHFINSFLELVDDSGLNIPSDCINPLLQFVALDLRNSLQLLDD